MKEYIFITTVSTKPTLFKNIPEVDLGFANLKSLGLKGSLKTESLLSPMLNQKCYPSLKKKGYMHKLR